MRALRPGWSWLPLPTRLRYYSPFRSRARATSLHRGSDGQYRVTVLGHRPLQCFLMPVTGESPGDRAHEARADPSRPALLGPPAPSLTPPIPIPSPVIPPGLTSSGWPYLMIRSLITALCLWQHCVAEEVPKWRKGAAAPPTGDCEDPRRPLVVTACLGRALSIAGQRRAAKVGG